jgi:hypothetical protein
MNLAISKSSNDLANIVLADGDVGEEGGGGSYDFAYPCYYPEIGDQNNWHSGECGTDTDYYFTFNNSIETTIIIKHCDFTQNGDHCEYGICIIIGAGSDDNISGGFTGQYCQG